jgi:uncharacterized membrane protein YkvA (DUF1232 family)
MIRLLRLWRLVAGDLSLLWFALRHRQRPIWLWPVTVALGLYALDPVNFALPFAGIVDDLILVPLLLHLVVRLLPTEIKTGYLGGTLMR